MSKSSKVTLSLALLFTAASVLGVYKMKSDSLDVRRIGVQRDDLKRAQREANIKELESQVLLRKELESAQKVIDPS